MCVEKEEDEKWAAFVKETKREREEEMEWERRGPNRFLVVAGML